MTRNSPCAASIIERSLKPVESMKRLLTTLAAFSFLFAAYGCGQSGPLFIPGDPSRIEQAPPATESAEEQDAEENGDDAGKE